MFRFAVAAVAAAVLSCSFVPANADDLPEKKRTVAGLYLTASEASDMLADPTVVFIDVRTRSEVTFVGMPSRVDKHIPYKLMPDMPVYDEEEGGYVLENNPDFSRAFRDFAQARGITPDTPIILICRSGSRSARAADTLYQIGFPRVYSVIDGFEGDKDPQGHRDVNGWKNAGLGWSYGIRPDQAYPLDQM